jgi:flagellar biosynthesis protein FlhG
VNKAKTERDFLLGQSIVEVVRKYLAVDLNLLGVVPNDDRIHESLKKLTPYVIEFPESEVSASVKSIVQKLVERDRLSDYVISSTP